MVPMEQSKRWGFSAAQKRELWERWRRGQSSNDIARALAKLRGSIYKVLSSSGGIEPAPRCRSRLALSLAEREEISRGLAEGQSLRAIAAAIQRAPSTVSREIVAIAAAPAIERPPPISALGPAPVARSPVGWQCADDCGSWSPAS